MSFASWLLGDRIVTFERRPDLMAFQITVTRRDGSSICKQIDDAQLMASRVPLPEMAQALFGHPLDRVAIGLVMRRELGGKGAEPQASLQDAPPLGQPPRAPTGEVRAAHAERFVEEPSTKPEPLAPPNPDLPFYRMHR